VNRAGAAESSSAAHLDPNDTTAIVTWGGRARKGQPEEAKARSGTRWSSAKWGGIAAGDWPQSLDAQKKKHKQRRLYRII